MKINEMFVSCQGEGRHCGTPVLMIRLSGCTRSCSFCDSKFHTEGKEIGYEEIIKRIRDSNVNVVIWTGGSPLLQRKGVYDIIKLTKGHEHHLETNGDLLTKKDVNTFTYIACSPKDKKTAKKVKKFLDECSEQFFYDIKIVTDLEMNKDLIPYATMLMPLSKIYPEKIGIIDSISLKDTNQTIRQNIWNYCVKNNIKYCPRLHVEVFGVEKRGV